LRWREPRQYSPGVVGEGACAARRMVLRRASASGMVAGGSEEGSRTESCRAGGDLGGAADKDGGDRSRADLRCAVSQASAEWERCGVRSIRPAGARVARRWVGAGEPKREAALHRAEGRVRTKWETGLFMFGAEMHDSVACKRVEISLSSL